MTREHATDDTDADTDAESSNSEVDTAGAGREAAGTFGAPGRTGSGLGDPSVASLPGFDDDGGPPSDPAVARLPEEAAFGGEEVDGPRVGPAGPAEAGSGAGRTDSTGTAGPTDGTGADGTGPEADGPSVSVHRVPEDADISGEEIAVQRQGKDESTEGSSDEEKRALARRLWNQGKHDRLLMLLDAGVLQTNHLPEEARNSEELFPDASGIDVSVENADVRSRAPRPGWGYKRTVSSTRPWTPPTDTGQVMDELTRSGGLLSESSESELRDASRAYSSGVDWVVERGSLFNPFVLAERGLIGAASAAGVDTETGLEWQLGGVDVDLVENGEGPVERFGEGLTSSILELGNVPMWASVGETGLEVAQNSATMLYEDPDNLGKLVATGGAFTGMVLRGLVRQAAENPFTFSGEFLGEVLAGKGIGKIAGIARRAGNAGRTVRAASGGKGDLGDTPSAETVPDGGNRGADADDTDRQVVADGGDEVEIEGQDLDDLDSVDISNLNNPRMAERVASDAGEHGVEFIRETNDATLKALFGNVRSASDLDVDDVSRLVKATDGDATDVVEDVSPGKYPDLLRLSSRNQRIVRDVIIEGEINGKSRFVDDSLEGGEVVDVAKQLQDNKYLDGSGDSLELADVVVISRRSRGEAMFMTRSDVDHAIERHVFGERASNRDKTSFYPTGIVIDKIGIDGPAKLPNRMPSANTDLQNQLKDFAYRTIREGHNEGSKMTNSGILRYGIEEITINTDSSHVQSVYPSEGGSVRRWHDGEWQKWNGSQWVEWTDYEP